MRRQRKLPLRPTVVGEVRTESCHCLATAFKQLPVAESRSRFGAAHSIVQPSDFFREAFKLPANIVDRGRKYLAGFSRAGLPIANPLDQKLGVRADLTDSTTHGDPYCLSRAHRIEHHDHRLRFFANRLRTADATPCRVSAGERSTTEAVARYRGRSTEDHELYVTISCRVSGRGV